MTQPMLRGVPASVRTLFALALLLPLAACSTTEQAADATADTAEDVAEGTADVATDVAEGTADVATDVYGAVTDAAGTAYDSVEDLFDDDAFDAGALVRPTSAGSAQGTVRFDETDSGLRVHVSLRDLAPGNHGFHIHQNADCSDADTDGDGQLEPAAASGGHWDPHNTNDHSAPTDAITDKHLGDLGNLFVASDGTVETTIMIDTYRPSEHDLDGHAVVVHSGRDDLATDPAGGAGTPVGCGVIEAR